MCKKIPCKLNTAHKKQILEAGYGLGMRICHFVAKICRFHRFCTHSVSRFCILSGSMVHYGDATVHMLNVNRC